MGAKGGAKLVANYGTRKLDAIVDIITNEKEDVNMDAKEYAKLDATKADAKVDTKIGAKLGAKGMQKMI